MSWRRGSDPRTTLASIQLFSNSKSNSIWLCITKWKLKNLYITTQQLISFKGINVILLWKKEDKYPLYPWSIVKCQNDPITKTILPPNTFINLFSCKGNTINIMFPATTILNPHCFIQKNVSPIICRLPFFSWRW